MMRKRCDPATAAVVIVAGIYTLIILLASLAYGAEQAVKVDTYTHQVLAPPASAGAIYDLNFTGLSLGGISGGGGTVPVGKSIWVDGINGSNSTGLAGRFDKPFLTIAAAVAAAGAGDAIYVGPGTFNQTSNIQLPDNVSLYGAGRDVTKITNSTTGIASTHAQIAPGTNSIVADLTINGSTGSNLSATAPIGALPGDTAFTSAIVRNCKIIGNSYGFYFTKAGAGGLIVYDTTIVVTWDTIYSLTGGPFEFYNCDMVSDGSVVSGAVAASGVNGTGGTVRLYGGKITISSQLSPSGLRANGATVEAHDIRIDVSGTGSPLDLNRTSGTLAVDDITRPDSGALVTSGTITQLSRYAIRDNNLSDLPSASTALTNLGATTVGGNLFTATNPSVLSYPKISATNTVSFLTPAQVLTDIGAQAAGSYANSGAVGSSGLTMSTGKLLGRNTAGTGAIEEITLGTNLSFTGTTLNAAGGSGSPGGSITQYQYNNSGAFGGVPSMTYDGTIPATIKLAPAANTATKGLLATDTTLAASGNQQYSPTIQLTGQGWKTNATAASQPVDWRIYNQPVQGAANPSTSLIFEPSINGSTFTGGFQFTSGTGQILPLSATDGSASLPTYVVRQGSSNTGMYGGTWAGSSIHFTSAGTNVLALTAGGSGAIGMISSARLAWSSSATDPTLIETGFARNAAAIVEVNNGTVGQWGALKSGVRDGGTATVTNGLTLGHQSTGTPAADFGTGILFNADDSTTADVTAGKIGVAWSNATHNAQSAYMDFLLVSSAIGPASKMRLSAVGGLSVGSTTDPGNGIINANIGLKIGNASLNFSHLAGTLALSQTSMSTNKLIGRATAATGVMEEITLGTNLSFTGTTLNAASTSPGGSNTQIQFNDSGAFGGDADFTWDKTGNSLTLGGTDTEIILKGITNEPSAPGAGLLTIYSKSVSGRMLPKIKGPSGIDTPLQPALFGNNIILYTPTNGSTVTGGFGTLWAKGGSAGTVSHPAETTGITNQIHRTRHANAVTTTNQAMGIVSISGSGLQFWRGNAAGQGGFFFSARFVIGLWAADTCRLFVGLGLGTEIVISDTVANNTVGLWHDTTDGANVLSLVTRDATTTTKTAITGATVAAGQGFDFYMFAKPNDSTIYYRLDDINAGTTLVDTSTTTTLPTNTAFLGPQVEMSNGTANITATTVAMDVARIYAESDH